MMTEDGLSALPDLPEPPDAELDKARASLARALEPARAYFGWLDGPFGRVFLARTRQGLCRVSFRKSEDALVDDLEERGLLPVSSRSELDRERRQLEEYFAGRRTRFELPVDLRVATPFQRDVLEAARTIPFGACQCYSDVAEQIGRPKAQRAVGNALGKNPVAIVIPCHRVTGAQGKLGGYTGGIDIKKTLMKIEGIDFEELS